MRGVKGALLHFNFGNDGRPFYFHVPTLYQNHLEFFIYDIKMESFTSNMRSILYFTFYFLKESEVLEAQLK